MSELTLQRFVKQFPRMICGTTTSNVVEFNSLQRADTFLATSPDEMNVTSQTSSRETNKSFV